MAALSKRAQLELRGWKFTPVPHFWAEGLVSNSQTGWKSPAFYDHKNPDAWIAVPPSRLQVAERRFEHRSPNGAVRWRGSKIAPHSLIPTCPALRPLSRLCRPPVLRASYPTFVNKPPLARCVLMLS